MDRNLPIGIFDSGVGGLTVYRALHERLPNERFVYLGDTARVPYGTKSLATVERYAVENSRFLEAHGIKLLVVACNTASALALPAIRKAINVPVIGVIEPGSRAAVEIAQGANIGVIATEATVQSHAYAKAIAAMGRDRSGHRTSVSALCFSGRRRLGRLGRSSHRCARLFERLQRNAFGALVLGCTHYPILRDVISETVGSER